MPETISPPQLMTLSGSAHVAIATGAVVAIGGQVGVGADGTTVSHALPAQTAAALRNLETAVKSAGCSVDDLVKVTYYVVARSPVELEDFKAGFSLATAQGVELPLNAAATLLRVQGLMSDEWLVEIDGLAVRTG